MSFIVPDWLEPGDEVAVIATARAVDHEAVKKGIEIISSWGLNVKSGESLYKHDHLFAGTDKQRIDDLQSALDNPGIKAILCARGGYGTSRILDSLDWTTFGKYPKWICGFSDVTALLCQVHKLGYACLHSSMPQLFRLENAQNDHEFLRESLFGEGITLKAGEQALNQQGSAEGVLIGGNLSLLVHLIGTSSEFSTDGKILFIEEVDEYLYQLDRMMVQLSRCGKLQNVAGVVVGHLTKMKEGDLKFGMDANGVIKSHLPEDIPVGFGLPFGHESPNYVVPMGINCRLEVTDQGSTLTSKD